MDTFRIDYDKIDVEAIMAQIRQRVREKKEVLYSDAELARLGGVTLPPTTEPEKLDPERDSVAEPLEPEYAELPTRGPRPGPVARDIGERVRRLNLDDIKDTEFVTEALGCVGEWNIDIAVDDLYRTSKGGIKGAFLRLMRSINRRLFKLTMNIDALFPQLHKQSQLNQTYVVVLHSLVQEISHLAVEYNTVAGVLNRLSGDFHRTRSELVDDINTVSADLRDAVGSIQSLDNDVKRVQFELQRDLSSSHNHLSREVNLLRDDFARLERKLDSLRGQVEGQRQQLEYVQARQRALEQLAVLRDEEPPAGGKTSEIPRGRYQAKDKKK